MDYDRLSPSYDERYRSNPLAGIDRALRGLVEELEPALGLEVGCGTGWWLPTLAGSSGRAIGVDRFPGMLARAPRGHARTRLVCADGNALPFERSSFDLIVLVNAIHHLAEPAVFIRDCVEHLVPGGSLALVHYDPRRGGQSWYVYDDFEGALEWDLSRFPSEGQLTGWMREAGLDGLEPEVAETIERRYAGKAVLDDYFLGKDSNSTLARLSDAAYERGLAKLRQRLNQAEASRETLRFDVRLELLLLTGRKP